LLSGACKLAPMTSGMYGFVVCRAWARRWRFCTSFSHDAARRVRMREEEEAEEAKVQDGEEEARAEAQQMMCPHWVLRMRSPA
jgi:hypothetical protein